MNWTMIWTVAPGDWLWMSAALTDGCSWQLRVRKHDHLFAQVVDVRLPSYRSRKNKGRATDPIVTLLADCGRKRTCPRCGQVYPEHVHHARLSQLHKLAIRVPVPTTVDEIEEYLCCEDTP